MKKLVMKVDDLRVESFSIQTKAGERRGTVQAHAQNSDLCLTLMCGHGSPTEWCYNDTLGCTFTANMDCLESMNCPI